MRKKERIQAILNALNRQYGTDAHCYLEHTTTWQLLVATILSAQCTDARVNIVTKELFVKYPTVKSMAEADLQTLEEDIHSTGFYHNKAVNLIGCAKAVLREFHGEVPVKMEELVSLPGVGRKTANVIRTNIYHEPGVVVDTHVKRISRALGLTKNEDPEKIEYDLMKVIPKEHWILVNYQFIQLGRTICKAPNPKCQECFLRPYCPKGGSPVKTSK